MWVWSLASLSGLRIQGWRSYGVGCRCDWDPALRWLWCRPAALAPIRPPCWELPYAAGVGLPPQKKKKIPEARLTWDIFFNLFLILANTTNLCCKPWHTLTHLILSTTLWRRYYYCNISGMRKWGSG